MAARPFWKGYLKLSLATCPVALTPATTDADKVRFHTLNRQKGTGSSAATSTLRPVNRGKKGKPRS